jgi:hypothetical protein
MQGPAVYTLIMATSSRFFMKRHEFNQILAEKESAQAFVRDYNFGAVNLRIDRPGNLWFTKFMFTRADRQLVLGYKQFKNLVSFTPWAQSKVQELLREMVAMNRMLYDMENEELVENQAVENFEPLTQN